MNAIEIKGLNKNYPGFSLQDINFSLPQGSIMGLVGANGAGKSTTIRLIMNAISRDGGSVSVLGVDNQSKEFDKIKEDIGIVLDEAYFPELLTAKVLGKIMKYTYEKWDNNCYESYLKSLSLPTDKAFKDFSRGMKMKLAIAVALSHNPKVLVLDEATSGLDPMVRDEMLDIFYEFTREQEHSILLSSHIVSDLEKICDYIAFIHKGKLIFCEKIDELFEKYAVVKLSKEEFEVFPKNDIKGVKQNKNGVEVLVIKSSLSSATEAEHSTLEDIILILAKGEYDS